MRRWLGVLMAALMVMALVTPSMAEEFFPPPGDGKGTIGGRAGQAWGVGIFDKVVIPSISAPSGNPPADTGWLYNKQVGGVSHLFFEDEAGTATDMNLAGATAWDDIGNPDAAKTITFSTYTTLFTGASTVADQWTFRCTGAFGDVSCVKIESLTGNPTDGTVLEVVSHDTDADALLVTANSINTILVAGSGNLNLLGGTGTVTFTDWEFTADGLLTITPDLGGTGITITPSAALTTGLDVSSANITNGVNLGATKLLGTTAVIDFTNFDVDASGNVVAAGNLTVTGIASVGTFKQDTIVPASAAPATLTINGAGAGGVTVGGTSTGTITLGGGATLVNLPSTVDMTLSGGTIGITDTGTGPTFSVTNNTITNSNLVTLSATALTSGNLVSATAGNVVNGSLFYAKVTDGAGFTGYYFRAYDGVADDFSVKRYGATIIGGLASTDMLTITAGDIQVTAGDIDVDLGIITIDTTADEGNRIARNNAVGTAAVMEIENTHATGGIALLIDQKSTTAAHYGIDIASAGATQIHFTANGAAGSGMLYDATNAWTGQALVIDAGPWLGTLNRGVIDFRSDIAATAEVGSVIYIVMRGTTADAAAIDGKGLYIHDNAAYTAGSYLVRLDSKNNVALHISNEGAAADGIKFDVAASYTGQGIVANLGAWLGTTNEGFIDVVSTAAATVPAGQIIRIRQLGTGQHAAAIAGSLLYLYDDAAAPAAGVSYAVTIQADHIEALSVPVGKVNVTETVTATGGVSAGNAADSFLYTDTVELTSQQIKALKATPITLVAAKGVNKIIELVSAVFILNYSTAVFTEDADNLVIEYEDGQDATAAIEMTGFIDQAADQVAFIRAATIPTMTAATAANKALRLYNPNDEIGGNAGNQSAMTVKVTYWVHTDGL